MACRAVAMDGQDRKMRFVIDGRVFAAIPDMVVGVVVACGVDNTKDMPEVSAMLAQSVAAVQARFSGQDVKKAREIVPYREAFRALGINPNRFPCSAEALFSRIGKGKGMPSINSLVDLNNAVSLKYVIPMGTHDLKDMPDAIEMRPATENDRFLPFGGGEEEVPDSGEVVYAVGNQVRTRRWTWRQSENGKITAETSTVFFPIDGFAGFNDVAVKAATDELAEKLVSFFNAEVRTGFVDRDHPEFVWSF